jgi:hypothetical protein
MTYGDMNTFLDDGTFSMSFFSWEAEESTYYVPLSSQLGSLNKGR